MLNSRAQSMSAVWCFDLENHIPNPIGLNWCRAIAPPLFAIAHQPPPDPAAPLHNYVSSENTREKNVCEMMLNRHKYQKESLCGSECDVCLARECVRVWFEYIYFWNWLSVYACAWILYPYMGIFSVCAITFGGCSVVVFFFFRSRPLSHWEIIHRRFVNDVMWHCCCCHCYWKVYYSVHFTYFPSIL